MRDWDRMVRSVAIVSAEHGDGRSSVAWGLGMAAARAGDRVLLIEADFRRPVLVGVPGHSVGLREVLSGRADLNAAVRPIPLAPPAGTVAVRAGADSRRRAARDAFQAAGEAAGDVRPEGLDLISAGQTPLDPVEALESSAMDAVLRRAESRYDLVIIDTAPLTLYPEALPLLGRVNGVVAVGKVGHSRRDMVLALRGQLRHLGAPLVGVVATSAMRISSVGFEANDGRRARTRHPVTKASGPTPPSPPHTRARAAHDILARRSK
jgi:Mrp family chromosome partitioning ATPase